VIFVEPCAGSAAVMRYLTGEWKLLGYAGGKDGYAHRIAELLGANRDDVDGIILAEPGLWLPFWQAAEAGKLSRVADEILKWRDSVDSRRELWENLRDWIPGNCDIEIDAARSLALLAGTHGGHERGGFKGKHKHRPNVDGFIPSLASLADRIETASMLILPPIKVYANAFDIVPIPGAICYIDPPYEGTTGYIHSLDRYQVLRLANRWSRVGARVGVSEQVPLTNALTNSTKWQATDISDYRRGQGRHALTTEWLTYNTGRRQR
jgi:hypothetical protein